MSDHCTLTRTQHPGRNHFKFWEQQLFAQTRRNNKSPNLHLYALPLPHDYQKRKSVGELDGLDIKDAKKLQEAADEIITQIREDFVQKLSDEECADGRLMFRRVRELSEDANYVEAYRGAKIDDKIGRLCDLLGDAVVFLCYCDNAVSSEGLISYSIVFCCVWLLNKVLWQALLVLKGLSLEVMAHMRS
ncbi:hypothetical protein BCON_0314g00080 [Botryotinia convoluta]|uniref:Uncharacterized protein n=1 Tax=Botryotinia convoluta TaxID=54673 RepID=A0A4Z1HC21_9HELO|nr:hypothetical protein BCON_0314g00080 [Botryotinia convoluta]